MLLGVCCQQVICFIVFVGLYIFGGLVLLFFMVLMLVMLVCIVGCQQVVFCLLLLIVDEIFYVVQLCGVKIIFNVGGVQVIVVFVFGIELVLKVDKIFGLGNVYVMEVKCQVSQCLDGVVIDMLVGLLEVLVIVDSGVNLDFVVFDLLLQVEYGLDLQVIFLILDVDMGSCVVEVVECQLVVLLCVEIVCVVFFVSWIIVVCDLVQCVVIFNQYGLEYLIIQICQVCELVDSIISVGFVFFGDWLLEFVGDYVLGINYVLLIYGYIVICLSFGLVDFQKWMIVQELLCDGFVVFVLMIEILVVVECFDVYKNVVMLCVVVLKE